MQKTIVLLLAGVLLCTPALTATISDGWGGYKIGMTPEQVRAVPGRSWGALKGSGPLGLMEAQQPATQDGVAYDLSLWFRPATSLDQIFLSSSKTTSLDGCRQVFVAAVKHAESDYGALGPLATAGAGSSIKMQDIAGARSRYRLSNINQTDSILYVFDARRIEDGKSLDISSDWTVKDKAQTEGECFTKIVFGKTR